MTLALLAIPSVGLPAKNHKNLDRPATDADLLRDYALARCLQHAFPGTETADDAGRAADLYMQLGEFSKPAGAYGILNDLADAVDVSATPPPRNKRLAILECIEFFESPKLKAALTKLGVR